MPEYPLSSNLLALFSGSFYGTAGPDKKGGEARRRVEARRGEKRTRKREREGEVDKENRRRWTQRCRTKDEENRRRWSTKMAEYAEGQDKPLCPHEGPQGPTRARGNGSRRLGLIFRESRYHILLLALPPPFLPVFPLPRRGLEGPSFFVISLFGPSIPSTSSSVFFFFAEASSIYQC